MRFYCVCDHYFFLIIYMFSGNFLSPVLISLKYRFSQSLMLSDKLAVMVQILDVFNPVPVHLLSQSLGYTP